MWKNKKILFVVANDANELNIFLTETTEPTIIQYFPPTEFAVLLYSHLFCSNISTDIKKLLI